MMEGRAEAMAAAACSNDQRMQCTTRVDEWQRRRGTHAHAEAVMDAEDDALPTCLSPVV